MTFVILLALKLVFGSLRVSEEAEYEGLDVSEHSESAYALGGGASLPAGSHASEPVRAYAPATKTA